WLNNSNAIVGDPTEIEIRIPGEDQEDKVTIEEYYDRFILSKIVEDYNANEWKVIKKKVVKPGSWNGKYQEVSINEEYDEAGFLATYLAKISQELPPLNEELNLVFLGAADQGKLPANEINSYVAFPISKRDKRDNSRWRVNGTSPIVNEKFVMLTYQLIENN